MTFAIDERAQSTLVGAILLFAILIIAFSSYQAGVVPNQNAEVEFNHNLEVQSDMQDLRNSLLDIRSVERIDEGNYSIVSEHRPARVRLGTRYPERLVALNPPAPSGTLETEPAESEFRIENATVDNAAIDGDFHEDPDRLLGESPSADLGTNFLLYRPDYSEYQSSPVTVLEHSLLYNDFQDADVRIRQQTVIQPNTTRLNIVLFEGDVSRSGAQAVTLDPQTLDGPTDPIPIESTGDPITIQIPTRSPMVWNETVSELDGVEFETAPSPDDTHVRVTLDAGRYDLRVTRVGFDSDASVADQQLKPLQIETPLGGAGGGNGTLPGPIVTDVSEDAGGSVRQGESFNLSANVNNIGTTEDNRGGTPIQAAEWFLEGSDPGEGNAIPMENISGNYLADLSVSVSDEVSASQLENGDNTLTVRAQDTRGIWGDDTERVTVRLLGPPTVETQAATDVNGSAATLNGDLTDLGTASEVDVLFQYREVGAGTWTNTTTQTRTTTGTFEETISGLEGGTDHEFRTVAESADGSDTGDTLTFATDGTAPTQDGLELEISGNRDLTSIDNGETVSYRVFRTFTDGSEEEITDETELSVTSDDDTVVSVDEAAFEITGESAGTAAITADDGAFTATVDVTVSNSYDIVSVTPASGGGNSIDVTFEIDTTDPNAQVNVQSLQSNGNVRDETGLIAVQGTQPQTESVAGANQASQVRVILYDSDGVEQDRLTVPYP